MNNKYYTKLLSTLVNKIILIEYMSGSGGCLVHRIIGSDYSNIYWDKDINNATDDSLNPLLWPDSGFHIQKPHSIPETEQANYTCHTGSSMFYKEQEVDPTVLYSSYMLDNNSEVSTVETTFDNEFTNFRNIKLDKGVVYVYESVNESLIYSEQFI